VGLKDITHKVADFKPENSRTTFLLIKNAGGYRAFIMTLIGDSDYLNGDKRKLEKNKYAKRDPNFSGMLLYYTPEGKYINHCQYKNGKKWTGTLATTKSNQSTEQDKSQSKQTSTITITTCTDFYTWYVKDDGTESPHEYSYTTGKISYTLESSDPNYDGTGSGGSGGSSGGGGTGTTSPPPTRVDCPTILSIAPNKDQNKSTLDNGETPKDTFDDDDGGFPPSIPPGCPTSSSTNSAFIHNNVNDSCLRRLVQAAIDRNISYNMTESMNGIFDSNLRFNLNFTDVPLANDTDGDTQASDAKGTSILNSDGSLRFTNLTALTLDIRLNSSTLPNASEEYVTATILHEALHAYFRATRSPIAFDHYNMVQEYIPWFNAAMKSIYPNMDEPIRVALAYGGLMRDVAFTMGDQSSLRNLYGGVNDSYKTAQSGTRCH
jgi:hypothetical protein